MEQQKGLMKLSMNLPGFVENAYESVEAMTKFADLLLESKLCPDHFYEKKKEGTKMVPDYTKGKTASVMIVLLQGYQLQLPPMTALQHVIPVNGLLSIKGDAAKTLIFNSGKLATGSWNETVEGSVQDQNMEVTITAKRQDTQETMSRSFSVEQAKRAGLWITESKIQGSDGWKYQKSAWYKYPQRMITYRALGFLARDLFPDVMSGIYTTEEAMDMPAETEVVIEGKNGVKVIIPDKDFNKNRSETLTNRANNKINDRSGNIDQPPRDLKQTPMTPDESFPPESNKELIAEDKEKSKTMLNGTEAYIPVYSESELKGMTLIQLLGIIGQDGLMVKAWEIDHGKNTNKKLRLIILAHYNNTIVSLIKKFYPEFESKQFEKSVEEIKKDLTSSKQEAKKKIEEERETRRTAVESTDEHSDEIPMESVGDEDMQQQEYESRVEEKVNEQLASNKHEIEVSDIPEGETRRSFEVAMVIFNEMADIAGIDNKRYVDILANFPELQKYKTKEDFCFMAGVSEINSLLNSV